VENVVDLLKEQIIVKINAVTDDAARIELFTLFNEYHATMAKQHKEELKYVRKNG
jgi:hypothetical protein